MQRATGSALLCILALGTLGSVAAGCKSSGGASDGDVVRFCRLVSRCSGVTESSCQASTRAARDQAAADGCSSQLGAAVRCAVGADVCEVTAECARANAALDACTSTPTPTPDATVTLPDAGVIVTPSAVRQSGEGMIEILHDGEWRPICDDGFSMDEANVACRHLGFSGALGYSTVTGPTDDFWLDDVSCDGTESFLDQCASSGWGYDNCTAGETQAVDCF